MTQIRTSKRSRTVALTTLTAAGTLTLTGCEDDPLAEAQVFQTVAECVSSGIARNECQEAYDAARADDATDAPRFENRDLCEGEFGTGQCEQRFAGSGGGGSFWVPLLGGFMIGNLVSGMDLDIDGRKRRKYAPLYRSTASGHGGYYYGGSNYGRMTPTSGGRYGMDPAAFNRPVSAPRVQSRSDVASRGGFGGRARASSS